MKRACLGRQRTGEAAGQPRLFAAAPGADHRSMADRDARLVRQGARRTTENRQDTAETQEERTTRARHFWDDLLRGFRRISATRISTTQRADYTTQIQGFQNSISQRLQNLRMARFLAEQEEEDVAADAVRLTDRVITDQEEEDAAAEEHRRPPEQDTGRTNTPPTAPTPREQAGTTSDSDETDEVAAQPPEQDASGSAALTTARGHSGTSPGRSVLWKGQHMLPSLH